MGYLRARSNANPGTFEMYYKYEAMQSDTILTHTLHNYGVFVNVKTFNNKDISEELGLLEQKIEPQMVTGGYSNLIR